MIARRRDLLLATVAVALACNRVTGQAESDAPLVELRDRQGERRLSLWKTPQGFRWQDTSEGSGRIRIEPGGGLQAQDSPGGAVGLGPDPSGSLQLRRLDGGLLRLSRDGGLLRVGDGAGIPVARVRVEKDEALVHDAGGVVILRARPEGGRIVVTDREGGAVAFVVGQTTPERAALVSLSSLSALERALLLAMPSL
jgi:hypothetical protein